MENKKRPFEQTGEEDGKRGKFDIEDDDYALALRLQAEEDEAGNMADLAVLGDEELAKKLSEEDGNLSNHDFRGMKDGEYKETYSTSTSSSTSSSFECGMKGPKHQTTLDNLYILDECSHKFCRTCIEKYVTEQISKVVSVPCPTCNKLLSIRDMKDLLPDQSQKKSKSGLVPKASAKQATERLSQELSHIMKANTNKEGISVEPINDNLYHWEVQFFGFDNELAKDMRTRRVDAIILHATFPANYPFSPPFLRVIRPRFAYRTGHVTVGGSICMELLTQKGWSPATTLESVLMTVRAQLLEGGARLDMYNKADYTEAEAKAAFDRMVREHGW